MKRVFKIYLYTFLIAFGTIILDIIEYRLMGMPFRGNINSILNSTPPLIAFILFFPTIYVLGDYFVRMMTKQNKKDLEEYKRLKGTSKKQKANNQ